MTDTDKTPDQGPTEAPTAPLPPVEETYATAAPTAAAVAQPAPDLHGPHGTHQASNAAIVAMIVGALLFAMLAFGSGWTARGVALRFQLAHGGYQMGQGYGRRGGMHGFGRQGQLPPGGQGYGRGFRGGPMDRGQGYGNPDGSVVPTGTNY